MVLHLIMEDKEDPSLDRSHEFTMMSDEDMTELTEKRGKLRERRARKKAGQKSKKEEEAAAEAAKLQVEREQEHAAATARRKENLLQPHESLSRLLKSGLTEMPEDRPEDAEDDS